jgi:hypothetical protein
MRPGKLCISSHSQLTVCVVTRDGLSEELNWSRLGDASTGNSDKLRGALQDADSHPTFPQSLRLVTELQPQVADMQH